MRTPERPREFAGIISIILGTALICWGGYRLGNKVDWVSNYLVKKVERTYEPSKAYSSEDVKKEFGYIRKSAHIAVGGLALIIGGIVIGETRKARSPIAKPTDYGKSLSSYRRQSVRKGSRENPWEIG